MITFAPLRLLPWLSIAIVFSLSHSAVSAAELAPKPVDQAEETSSYKTSQLQGWTLHLSNDFLKSQSEAWKIAEPLLEKQLQEIVRVVPRDALAELRKVPLWISPEYAGIGPRAEYHPDRSWLVDNGRNPQMARSIEITNIAIFPAECRRMPWFILHELAHAYHHRFLSFEEPRIIAAYQAASALGTYNHVRRRDAEGNLRFGKAYAMTNHKEYFAEITEAYFGTNDFFPFDQKELKTVDPGGFKLLQEIWSLPASSASPDSEKAPRTAR